MSHDRRKGKKTMICVPKVLWQFGSRTVRSIEKTLILSMQNVCKAQKNSKATSTLSQVKLKMQILCKTCSMPTLKRNRSVCC